MNTEPGWDLYRTLLAVLDEGSLSAAARALGLTQPTVARHVDALEDALGVPLFVRSPRGLSPTERALALRPYAETLAYTAAALVRAASPTADAVEGTVRLSASEVVAVEHLPPICAALRRRHPGLVIELVASNTVDDLLRRQADVAVRMVEPTQDALVARRVGSIALGLYAHRDYLARRGVPTSLAALAGHDVIGYDRETPAMRAYALRYPELARPAFALRTDDDVVKLAMVRAGFGLGVCQVPVAERDPALVRVLGDVFELPLGVWVVMHEDLRHAPRCRVVFDALVEGLAGACRGEARRG